MAWPFYDVKDGIYSITKDEVTISVPAKDGVEADEKIFAVIKQVAGMLGD